jgi:hypothetical protein
MPIEPTRSDTWAVNVELEYDGAMHDLGIWDKKSGGEVDSEEGKYKPGAMAATISLGGSKNVGNITVSRLYRLVRDHQNLAQRFITAAGRSNVRLKQQPMDIDANPFGRPIVYNGTLKRVTFPEVDSEGTDAALVELEITVEGQPVV